MCTSDARRARSDARSSRGEAASLSQMSEHQRAANVDSWKPLKPLAALFLSLIPSNGLSLGRLQVRSLGALRPSTDIVTPAMSLKPLGGRWDERAFTGFKDVAERNLNPSSSALAALASLLPTAAFADDGGENWLQSTEAHDLLIYLAETVINWGVPATVAGGLAIVVAGSRSAGNQEMPDLPPGLAKAFGISPEPKEYLQIEKLNNKLQSYEYSFRKASISKSAALRIRGRQEIERQFGAVFESSGLDTKTAEEVFNIAKKYRKAEERVTKQLEEQMIRLRVSTLSPRRNANEPSKTTQEAKEVSVDPGAGEGGEQKDDKKKTEDITKAGNVPMENPMDAMASMGERFGLERSISALQKQIMMLELDFLNELKQILTKDQADALANVLEPSGFAAKKRAFKPTAEVDNDANIPRLGGRLDTLSALVTAAAEAAGRSKHVYVLKFFGDVTASQVSQLREEITAVLRNSDVENRGDEVVVVLNTGGGTVTGYGLAGAQLQRLKQAGIPLTICVEQVAASGGYLMACVADTLIASPFATLGSIGVITEQPNVYERLQREGVQFSTVTAGKFKRTLTPTKKIEKQDVEKLKEDIEQVLVIFKGWVAENRPAVDIEKIATGETWIGPDALERNMVDKLSTVDDVLSDHVDAGAQVFSVRYAKKSSPLAAFGVGDDQGTAKTLKDWLLRRGLAGALPSPGDLGPIAEETLKQLVREGRLNPEMLAIRPQNEAEPMLQYRDPYDEYERDNAASADFW